MELSGLPPHVKGSPLILSAILGIACTIGPLGAQTVHNVGDAASLAAAMSSLGNGDTINFTGNITLAAPLPFLQATGVTVNGNGHTLDGAGAYSAFFVYAGSSAINNLTIANTIAYGGSSLGGGGGLGAGGAVFVAVGASVALADITFGNNQAIGGSSLSNQNNGGAGLPGYPAGTTGASDTTSGGTAGGGGAGGFGSGGGGGGNNPNGYGGGGGSGGFGGGGGNGGSGIAGGRGGHGGYGGGGGGGGQGTTSTYGSGSAGFGAGVGGGSFGGFLTDAFGGGGGAGLGGAIFVMQGASVTFSGNMVQSGGAVAGGSGILGGGNGQAAGAGVFLQGNGTLSFAPGAGQTQTIGDVITDEVGSGLSGNGGTNGQWGLTKTGAGTLVLNAAGQFNGPTSLTGGTLVLGHAAALQHSTLAVTSSLSFGSLAGATLGGLAGSGNIALTNNAAAAVALTVGQNNADTTYAGVLSGAGSLIKVGTGALTLSGVNSSFAALTVNAGTLNLNAAHTVSSLNGSGGTINFTAPLTVNNTGADDFAGALSGTDLTKTGSGSLTLTGGSNLGGTVAVQNGTLAVGSPLTAAVTTLTLGAGATGGELRYFGIGANTVSSGQILVSGTGDNRLSSTIGAGATLSINSPISATTVGAKLTLDGVGYNGSAPISLNGSITDGAGTLGLVVASGQITLNGSGSSFSGGLAVNGGSLYTTQNLTITSLSGGGAVGAVGNRVLTLNNTGSDIFAGVIVDGYDGTNPNNRGLFVKSGPGTLTLTSAAGSYYSGATTISGGTLWANNTSGSALGYGSVMVQAGATLGGTGFIGGLNPFDGVRGGATTIAAGGHLVPGDAAAAGRLTFAGGLALNDGALLDFQLGGTSDQLRVSGGALAGPASAAGATFHFSAAPGFAAGTYTLIDGTGATLSGFDLTDFTLGSGIAGYSFVFGLTGNVLSVTATAIPEPATYAALVGLLALGLAIRRGRRA